SETINSNVKFHSNSVTMLSDVGKIKDKRSIESLKKQFNFSDKAFVRKVDPDNMVKLEVDGMCLGYIYIETDTGSGINGPANPLLKAMTGMLGHDNGGSGITANSVGMDNGYFSNNNTSKNNNSTSISGDELESGNTAMRYSAFVDVFVKDISHKIDKDFINTNSSFREIIHRLMKKNYILEKGINITFLEPSEVVHFKLDSEDKTYGVSRINSSLFFAKLYLSVLLTNIMTKINQSRAQRVFYVETGLDNDYEGAIQEVIRNIRQQDIPTDVFSTESSLSNVLRQVGSQENYYIPRIDGTAPLDIDTIAGIQVDIDDDFLEWLKKSLMTGTGVPFNYIDATQDTDYARSLSMQNQSFVRRVVEYQQDFGEFFTELVQKIYDIEYPESESDKSSK